MGFEAIQHYFASGWQALTGQAILNWSSVTEMFNLVTLLDIIFVLFLLWWVWRKIKGTALANMIPKVGWVLLIIFLSKLLGFIAVFYASFAALIILLIGMGVLYHQDLKKIWEGELHYTLAGKSLLNGEYHPKRFLTELSDTVVALAKAHIPALLVIRTDISLNKLVENGTYLNTPFNKDFVLDIFSRRSKLSAAAMIVDNGIIIAAGSTLAVNSPKRFLFSLTNSAIKQAAENYSALIIITHKDREDISVLHKQGSYTKLSPRNLDRILKNILLS